MVMGQKNKFVTDDAASPHFNFEVRGFDWTEKQQDFIDDSLKVENKIIICEAPPGVGKTAMSLFVSLTLLSQQRVGKILYVRNPVESSDDRLGFLKGDYEEKMAPFAAPMVDNLQKLLSESDNRKLARENQIDAIALGYFKGRTFDNTALIVDEAEDFNRQQMLLTMTRIGKWSKVFIIGDSKQTNVMHSGFSEAISLFDTDRARENGIIIKRFTSEDIKRSGISRFVYSEYNTLC
jgi:phosphate starvation-inducible PhoH-like protein